MAVVLGVVLEFIGSSLVGTLLILGGVSMGIGLARTRSEYWQRQGRFLATRSRAGISSADYEDAAGGTDLARRDQERFGR